MPIMRGQDSLGPYYKFGATGKHYYYTAGNASSRSRARKRAALQGRAIEWRKHSGA